MGFFAEFNVWLNALLVSYIGDNTARVAAALEPAVVTLATIYVMVWGYLQLTGAIEEAFVTGLRRIVTLVVVLGVGLRLWLYNSLVVDTFFNAPGQLAAAIVGAYDSVAVIDQILFSGGDVAEALLAKGGILSGSLTYTAAGYFVYLTVGLTVIYTVFLLALSRIALSVLLALGPLFVLLLLFRETRRLFESWIAQLANYALIAVLTVLVVALLMQLLTIAAAQAEAAGPTIQIAQAVRVCLAAGLILLVLRQVMPIASGLASGIVLQSYGVVSRSAGWSARQSAGLGAIAAVTTARVGMSAARVAFTSRRARRSERSVSVGAI